MSRALAQVAEQRSAAAGLCSSPAGRVGRARRGAPPSRRTSRRRRAAAASSTSSAWSGSSGEADARPRRAARGRRGRTARRRRRRTRPAKASASASAARRSAAGPRTRRRRAGPRCRRRGRRSRRRSATCSSSASPRSWPRVSLTSLNRSTSSSSSPTCRRCATLAADRALEPVAEQSAVGQAGQRVEQGQLGRSPAAERRSGGWRCGRCGRAAATARRARRPRAERSAGSPPRPAGRRPRTAARRSMDRADDAGSTTGTQDTTRRFRAGRLDAGRARSRRGPRELSRVAIRQRGVEAALAVVEQAPSGDQIRRELTACRSAR